MTNYDALLARTIDSAEKWDSILSQLPNPHPLQSWAWGELKSRWGWSMLPVCWEINGNPMAAAMILRNKIGRTPFAMLYAPKGPILAYEDSELRQRVLDSLALIARSERAIFIKIDPDVVQAIGEQPLPQPLGQAMISDLNMRGWCYSAEQIQFQNSVVQPLTLDEADILAQMKQKTRYNIRLAARREVTVRAGTAADFDTIANIYVRTSARNQFAIRDKAYYLDVWATFSKFGMCHMLIAEYEGQPLAAVVLIYNDDRCLYMYGASTEQERKRMPTYLLQWEAIRWAKEHGCTLYDFWGAPDHFDETDRMWGVWRFKRGFNATVVRHIGAWDYPVWPPLYTLFNQMLPKYRQLLGRLRR